MGECGRAALVYIDCNPIEKNRECDIVKNTLKSARKFFQKSDNQINWINLSCIRISLIPEKIRQKICLFTELWRISFRPSVSLCTVEEWQAA
jgi:hypothetical protein